MRFATFLIWRSVQQGKFHLFIMTQQMASIRMKTFDIPHKGLRSLLAKVNLLAGNTDFSDPAQIDTLEQTALHLFRLLTEHAHDEDDILLAALEQRCPGATFTNSREHEIIEQQQALLEDLLHNLLDKARKGEDVQHISAQFYAAINRFQSAYLLHMLEEEGETQQHLWKYFSDAELLDLRKQIVGRMAPESLLLWYRYSAPAMPHAERLQWLMAVRAGAPPAFFNQIMDTLHQVLAEPDYQKLEHATQQAA